MTQCGKPLCSHDRCWRLAKEPSSSPVAVTFDRCSPACAHVTSCQQPLSRVFIPSWTVSRHDPSYNHPDTKHVPHVHSTLLPCVVDQTEFSAPGRPRRSHRLRYPGVARNLSGRRNNGELVSCRQGLDVLTPIIYRYGAGLI